MLQTDALEETAMTTRQPIYKSLYAQVIVAIIVGIALGHWYPETAVTLKPLGDGFIKLIKMVIAPIIFCTVVSGIAGMQSMKSVGKPAATRCSTSKSFRPSR
jgi:aerobic C4-dicarboxylate transport protein